MLRPSFIRGVVCRPNPSILAAAAALILCASIAAAQDRDAPVAGQRQFEPGKFPNVAVRHLPRPDAEYYSMRGAAEKMRQPRPRRLTERPGPPGVGGAWVTLDERFAVPHSLEEGSHACGAVGKHTCGSAEATESIEGPVEETNSEADNSKAETADTQKLAPPQAQTDTTVEEAE